MKIPDAGMEHELGAKITSKIGRVAIEVTSDIIVSPLEYTGCKQGELPEGELCYGQRDQPSPLHETGEGQKPSRARQIQGEVQVG